jgi:hypothetical protein
MYKLALFLLLSSPTFADVYYDGRYGGRAGWYSAPQCNKRNCAMDNYIRELLAAQRKSVSILSPTPTTTFVQAPAPTQFTQYTLTSAPVQAPTQYKLVTKTRQVPYTEQVQQCQFNRWGKKIGCTIVNVTKYRTETYTERVPIPAAPAVSSVPHEPAELAVTKLHPTPYEELHTLLPLLTPENGQVVADLGCGDGRVLLAVCKKYNCKGLGIELNPDSARMAVESAAVLAIPITIKVGDILDQSYDNVDIVYMYLYTPLIKRVIPKLRRGTRVVTYLHSPHPTATQIGDFYVWTKQ